jgi:predicted DNA-binding transcriptional regulator AlpA
MIQKNYQKISDSLSQAQQIVAEAKKNEKDFTKELEPTFREGNDELWRAKKCAARAGMCLSYWWLLVQQKIAPQPAVRLKRFTAWRASSVLQFIENLANGNSQM